MKKTCSFCRKEVNSSDGFTRFALGRQYFICNEKKCRDRAHDMIMKIVLNKKQGEHNDKRRANKV